MRPEFSATRVETYWRRFTVVLFVLIPLDMVTTLYAAASVGSEAEANPLIRIALTRGIVVYSAVNLAAAIVAIGGFYTLIKTFRATEAPHDRYAKKGIEIWLVLLVVGGLMVLINNLLVILKGRSLFVI